MLQCILGTSPTLGLARKRYCSHMLVILCHLSGFWINTNASCIRGRAMQIWLYHFRANSSAKPVLFLSLNDWAKKPCRPEIAGSQTSLGVPDLIWVACDYVENQRKNKNILKNIKKRGKQTQLTKKTKQNTILCSESMSHFGKA